MKKVALKTKPQAASPDEWVSAGAGLKTDESETGEVIPVPVGADIGSAVVMKRLTIDIPQELHTRIKMQCAARGRKMADEIRELLESRFNDNE